MYALCFAFIDIFSNSKIEKKDRDANCVRLGIFELVGQTCDIE